MVEAAFLVASGNGSGGVDIIALGFDESAVVASVAQEDVIALAAHPDRKLIYASSSAGGGSITSIDLRTGSTAVISGVGETHCFLLLADDEGGIGDPTVLLSANYGDGSLVACSLHEGHVGEVSSRVSFAWEGRPGTDPSRQNASHPHWVGHDGDLLVADLGNDVIHDVSLLGGKLVNRGVHRRFPAGSGPRHVCRDATGGLWASHELSNGVSRLGPDAIAISSSSNRWVPDDIARNHVGDITFEPESDVVVTANRELNTLGIFTRGRYGIESVAEIDCGGQWPHQFAQQDGTLAVTNRDSGSVAVFDVGPSWWENSPEIFDVLNPGAIIAAPLWVEDL